MPSWHESDAFWEAMHPVFFTPSHWERAKEDARDVVGLLGLSRGDSLLDLGCGPGRHALAFARLGLAVTGFDRTESYLHEARRRAAACGSTAHFESGDMRRLSYDARFDAVVNLSTSFGYFDDPADDEVVLRGIHAALRPGGGLVMQIINLAAVRSAFEPEATFTLEDGTRVTERRRPVGDNGVVTKTRVVEAPGAPPASFDVSHRLFTPDRLAGMFARSGFTDVRSLGTLRGDPYGDTAKMLVVVGRK